MNCSYLLIIISALLILVSLQAKDCYAQYYGVDRDIHYSQQRAIQLEAMRQQQILMQEQARQQQQLNQMYQNDYNRMQDLHHGHRHQPNGTIQYFQR